MAGKGMERADDVVTLTSENQFLNTHQSVHNGGAGASQEWQILLKERGKSKDHSNSLARKLVAALKDALAIRSS